MLKPELIINGTAEAIEAARHQLDLVLLRFDETEAEGNAATGGRYGHAKTAISAAYLSVRLAQSLLAECETSEEPAP